MSNQATRDESIKEWQQPVYNKKTGSMHVRPLRLDGRVLCYLCGQAPATTYDHLPPQSFFPKQAAVKGYKLPSCSPCNNSWSKDDEHVRDYFSLSGWNQEAQEVFRQGTRASYMKLRNRLMKVSKLDRINRDLSLIDLVTKEGLYLGSAASIKIDAKRVERLIIRIAKGLYYQHFGKPLDPKCRIECIFKPPTETIDLLQEIIHGPTEGIRKFIGAFGDVFSYGGFVDESDEVTSTWWMSFFATHGAIVIVEPPD